MSASDLFGLEPHAVARRTDSETSHEAADSVKDITDTQEFILDCFSCWGPMTDEQLMDTINPRSKPMEHLISPSGLRSRRAELVANGLLEWSGGYGETRAGRRSRIWRVKR